ncbi:hypothetical protein [Shewanella sp. GutDb-MelDb]|uniref:hypothetical protein n=1 Tax=Shewanella sp. GutDb-MelDb TaxID=2058316 RepID=UPI000C7B9AFF|nr:hypothetical protein [Shewanella sp. GutDb-MelDb]PKG57729.1 hypothetical protein CXF82_08115 [Shewanella sp. GutDb-MelDb]
MSAFANFKKRHEAKQAAAQGSTEKPTMAAPMDTNPALRLLAALLGCDEQDAIAKATELVAQRAHSSQMTIDIEPAADGDKTVIESNLKDTASTVEQAADSVETAASDVSEASSDLVHRTDEIADVTADLKEATAELKKPSAGPQSSPSEKSTKRNESSKK